MVQLLKELLAAEQSLQQELQTITADRLAVEKRDRWLQRRAENLRKLRLIQEMMRQPGNDGAPAPVPLPGF